MEYPIGNAAAAVPPVPPRRAQSNKMPSSNGDRHFPIGLAQGVDVDDVETNDLRRNYLASYLDNIPLYDRPHRIAYNVRKQPSHNPYLVKGKHYTVLHVQNLPFFVSCVREDSNRVSADHLCAMMRTIIDGLHYATHGTGYPHQVSIRCKPDFTLAFFAFQICHDHPLPTSHLPVTGCRSLRGENITVPILMDRTCLHVGSKAIMDGYTALFDTTSTKGRRFMVQKDRHYLSAGLPCRCVKIEVVCHEVGYGQIESYANTV